MIVNFIGGWNVRSIAILLYQVTIENAEQWLEICKLIQRALSRHVKVHNSASWRSFNSIKWNLIRDENLNLQGNLAWIKRQTHWIEKKNSFHQKLTPTPLISILWRVLLKLPWARLLSVKVQILQPIVWKSLDFGCLVAECERLMSFMLESLQSQKPWNSFFFPVRKKSSCLSLKFIFCARFVFLS